MALKSSIVFKRDRIEIGWEINARFERAWMLEIGDQRTTKSETCTSKAGNGGVQHGHSFLCITWLLERQAKMQLTEKMHDFIN